jgi:hypothetical protein
MERIWKGTATATDTECIRRRTFGHPDEPDLCVTKWQQAQLITFRNTTRQAWNNQAAIWHSIQAGNQIFISPFIDEGLPCSRGTIIWTAGNKTEMLTIWNVVCMDTEAMVTYNIAVELNIDANGNKAVIKEVVRHPQDHITKAGKKIQTNLVVKLSIATSN